MSKYYISLQPNGIYHVFSRANGWEKMFLDEEDYVKFLGKLIGYVLPVADLLGWCLIPNHFHLLVRIREPEIIKCHFRAKKRKANVDDLVIPDFLMKQFSNFLNSYAKSFNKKYKRKGSLFMDYMKRKEIETDEQLGATIFYIHKNPVHHGRSRDLKDWKWSSYLDYLTSDDSFIEKKTVLNWFQGIEHFIAYHQQPIYLKKAVVPYEDL